MQSYSCFCTKLFLFFFSLIYCSSAQYQVSPRFGSYQVTVFYETKNTQKGHTATGYTYPYTLTETYSNINSIGLVLCGYKFQSGLSFSFDAQVTYPLANNSVSIYFNPIDTLQAYYVTFYIVLTTQDNLYFSLLTGNYTFQNLSLQPRAFSITTESVLVPSPYMYLTSYPMQVGCSGLHMIVNSSTYSMFFFALQGAFSTVNSSILQADFYTASNYYDKILNVSFSIIALNLSASSLYPSWQGPVLYINNVPSSLSSYLPDFYVPPLYGPNFNKKCIFFMRQIIFQTMTNIREISFNSTNNYITDIAQHYDSLVQGQFVSFCSMECTSDAFSNVGTCIYCSLSFAYCISCTNSSVCLKCAISMYFRVPSNACRCIVPSWMVIGGCTVIENCLAITKDTLTNMTICTHCRTGFHVDKGICACDIEFLINGICGIHVVACLTITKVNATQICAFCDAYANFTLSLIDKNACTCKPEMILFNDTCIEICGDGILLGFYDCDDGNLMDGDGCSSICTVQSRFKCVNGSETAPSICIFYPFALNLTLYQIYRFSEENQGVFQFNLSSAFSNIKTLSSFDFDDFETTLNFTCPSNSFTISSGSYLNGLFIFNVNFTSNLEDLEGNLLVMFRSNKIIYKNISLNFQVISSDIPLIISTKQQEYRIIKITLDYFCILPWLIFLIASFFHKMIGVETLNVFQIIFFLQSQSASYSPLLSVLKNLKFTLNYNSFFNDQNFFNSNGYIFSRMELKSNFLENICIIGGIYILVTLGFILIKIIKIIIISKRQQQLNSTLESSDNSKIKTFEIWYYCVFCFPLAFAFVIQANLALYAENMNKINAPSSGIANGLTLVVIFLIFWLMGLVVFSEMLNDKKKKMQINLTKCSSSYISLYFIYLYGLIVLGLFAMHFTSSFSHRASISSMLALNSWVFLYTLLLLIQRPYTFHIHNVSIILNQLTILYFTVWLNVQYYFKIESQTIQLFALIILLGLLFFVCVFGIVRICIEYRYGCIITPFSTQNLRKAIMEETKKSIFFEENHALQKLKVISQEGNKNEIPSELFECKKQKMEIEKTINFETRIIKNADTQKQKKQENDQQASQIGSKRTKLKQIPQQLVRIRQKLKQSLIESKLKESQAIIE